MLSNFMYKYDLVDVWRHNNPGTREYTYIDLSGRGRNSRIDLFMMSKDILRYGKNCEITQAPAPDHKAVTLQLMFNKRQRGKGYWKLNSSIVKETEYQELIQNVIKETHKEYHSELSHVQFWEFLKVRIKEYTLHYCINKARGKRNDIKLLERDIDDIDQQINYNDKESEKLIEMRKNLKYKLDQLYIDKARGAQIRSRVKWIEEGEKSSSYFLNLERKGKVIM